MFRIITTIALCFCIYSGYATESYHEDDLVSSSEMAAFRTKMRRESDVSDFAEYNHSYGKQKENGYFQQSVAILYKERNSNTHLIASNAKEAAKLGRIDALFLLDDFLNQKDKAAIYLLQLMFNPRIQTFTSVTSFLKENSEAKTSVIPEVLELNDVQLAYRHTREDCTYVYYPPLAFFKATAENFEKLKKLVGDESQIIDVLNTISTPEYIKTIPEKFKNPEKYFR